MACDPYKTHKYNRQIRVGVYIREKQCIRCGIEYTNTSQGKRMSFATKKKGAMQ